MLYTSLHKLVPFKSVLKTRKEMRTYTRITPVLSRNSASLIEGASFAVLGRGHDCDIRRQHLSHWHKGRASQNRSVMSHRRDPGHSGALRLRITHYGLRVAPYDVEIKYDWPPMKFISNHETCFNNQLMG